MPNKTAKDYQKGYTKPELREQLKEKIKQESKGGKSGEWSARKSQLLMKEYERQGGGYKNAGKKTPEQKSLSQWTKEDWQTVDNTAAIKDGETVRYLPKKVWEQLTDEEKYEVNKLKIIGSKNGKQMVGNTKVVKNILKTRRSRQD